MQCPVCKNHRCRNVELEAHLKAGACPGCGGIWLSRQAYSTWLEHHGETLPEKPFTDVTFDVHDTQAAKLCPECNRILLKYKVGHGLDFAVDHCPGCGGIWLDTNEWHALQERNLHDEIHMMFSTAWQNEVRGAEMAERLDQAYASRFGSETYEHVKDVRQWLQDHPQKRALLAFLADEDPFRM